MTSFFLRAKRGALGIRPSSGSPRRRSISSSLRARLSITSSRNASPSPKDGAAQQRPHRVRLRSGRNLFGCCSGPDERVTSLEQFERPKLPLPVREVRVESGLGRAPGSQLPEALCEIAARLAKRRLVEFAAVGDERLCVGGRYLRRDPGIAARYREPKQVVVDPGCDVRAPENERSVHPWGVRNTRSALHDLRNARERRLCVGESLWILVDAGVRGTEHRGADVGRVDQDVGRRLVLRVLSSGDDERGRGEDDERHEHDPPAAPQAREVLAEGPRLLFSCSLAHA